MLEYVKGMIFWLKSSRPEHDWNVTWAPGEIGTRLRFRHKERTEVLDVELRQEPDGACVMWISRGALHVEGDFRTLWFKDYDVMLTGHLLGGTVTFWTGDYDADEAALWEILNAYLACLIKRREFSQIPEPKLRRIET